MSDPAPSQPLKFSPMGIATCPGATLFTLMPKRPYSKAWALVIAMMPPFEAEYAIPPPATIPAIEEMWTIEPALRAFI